MVLSTPPGRSFPTYAFALDPKGQNDHRFVCGETRIAGALNPTTNRKDAGFTDLKLFHNADHSHRSPVNNVATSFGDALILLASRSCSPIVHRAILGTTVFTRFRSQPDDFLYDVVSSLKELSRTAKIERELLSDLEIIPGDWGKVGSGWLARLLSSRSASSEGWRQDSPVPLARSRVSVTRKRNLAKRSDEKPLRIESSSSGKFRA